MAPTSYSTIGRLASIAAYLYTPGIRYPDWVEDVKCAAARDGLAYSNHRAIDEAICIAEERLRHAGRWQPPAPPLPPAREIEPPKIPSDRQAHRVFRELLARLATMKKL